MNRFIALALCSAVFAGATAQSARVVEFDNPKVKIFIPPKDIACGKAIICCPGGGYSMKAINHEGYDWTPWLNNEGVAVAVVDYELPEGDRHRPLGDVAATYKILADSAAVWNIAPNAVGVMGFSAGGHLASTVATHPDESFAPAFQILFYPVVSLDKAITHDHTRIGFIGENGDDKLAAEYSSENKVSPSTPRAIMFLSSDDELVPPENSIRYFSALQRNGVPVSMMVYPEGGHGWGFGTQFRYHDEVLSTLSAWLKSF